MDIEGFGTTVARSTPVEELREVVSYGKLVMRNELRPWSEFGESFSMPPQEAFRSGSGKFEVAKKRALINLLYYRVNYAALASGIVALECVFWNGRVLLVVLGALAEAFFLFHLKKHRPIRLGNAVMTEEQKTSALVGSIAALGFLFGALTATFLTGFICAGVIGAHAILRPRSTRSQFSSLGASISLPAPQTAGTSYSGSPALSGPAESTDSFSLEYVEEVRKREYELRRLRNAEYAKRRDVVLRERSTSSSSSGSAQSSAYNNIVGAGSSFSDVPALPETEEEEVEEKGDADERQSAFQGPSKQSRVKVHIPARMVTLAANKKIE